MSQVCPQVNIVMQRETVDVSQSNPIFMIGIFQIYFHNRPILNWSQYIVHDIYGAVWLSILHYQLP